MNLTSEVKLLAYKCFFDQIVLDTVQQLNNIKPEIFVYV